VKTAWRNILRKHNLSSKFSNIDKQVFPKLLNELTDKNQIKPPEAFLRRHAVSGFESTGIYPLDKIAMKSKLKLISDTRLDSHVNQNDNAESSDEEDSSDGESVVNDQPIVNSQTQIQQFSQYGNSNASANVKV
jgi:hypothetical protein